LLRLFTSVSVFDGIDDRLRIRSNGLGNCDFESALKLGNGKVELSILEESPGFRDAPLGEPVSALRRAGSEAREYVLRLFRTGIDGTLIGQLGFSPTFLPIELVSARPLALETAGTKNAT